MQQYFCKKNSSKERRRKKWLAVPLRANNSEPFLLTINCLYEYVTIIGNTIPCKMYVHLLLRNLRQAETIRIQFEYNLNIIMIQYN